MITDLSCGNIILLTKKKAKIPFQVTKRGQIEKWISFLDGTWSNCVWLYLSISWSDEDSRNKEHNFPSDHTFTLAHFSAPISLHEHHSDTLGTMFH